MATHSSILTWKIPWTEELVGCSLWGHMTEHASMSWVEADGLIAINRGAAAKSLQSCPTLCDPIDGSLPGSSIPGILQARILECVAISFSNKQR